MEKTERKFTVKVSSPNDSKRVLQIEIPREEVDKAEAKALSRLQRQLKVPGFRKGKVPTRYIEKNYAEDIRGNAVQNLLPEVYQDALMQEGITPISDPKFENLKTEKGGDITVDVAVEIRPEIEVKGYTGVKVKVKQRDIGDKEVNEALEQLQERMSTYKVVDRKVKDGDLVVIDFVPLLESGEPNAAGATQNYAVDLAGGSLLKEFREGLVGMEMRDEKDIEVQYPEDFPEKENAGTRRTFRVTVKEVKEKQLPELNDEFAKQAGEQFPTMDALREQVRSDLIKEEDKRYQHEIEEAIMDKVIEDNPFDVPESMINNYLASVLDEDKRRRPHVADENERIKEIQEHFHPAAVRTIRKFILLEGIKKQENIEIDDDAIDKRIDELSQGGDESRVEEIRKYFKDPHRRRNLGNEMLDRKVLDFLRGSARISG